MGLYGGVAENRKVAGCGDGDQSLSRLGGVTACGSAGTESDPRGAGLLRELQIRQGHCLLSGVRIGEEARALQTGGC